MQWLVGVLAAVSIAFASGFFGSNTTAPATPIVQPQSATSVVTPEPILKETNVQQVDRVPTDTNGETDTSQNSQPVYDSSAVSESDSSAVDNTSQDGQPSSDTSEADTANTSDGLSNDNSYTNVSGDTVHSPAYSTDGDIPAGASAQCDDGTYSFSQHRSGTCSHHGGVSTWY